ncbi:hypothetical protein [Robbsia sp. KACC 23696]|uniref:type IV pilin protein n=1 Tax=Robbsia sp. KACC 23696 TaxID=3149231 RepID=UPI00325AC522
MPTPTPTPAPITRRLSSRRWIRAFTLIETLIAVMLLSAITLFAVPMYRDAAARSHRMMAIDALRERAFAMAWLNGASSNGAAGGVLRPVTRSAHDDARSMGVSPHAAMEGIYRLEVLQSGNGENVVRATPVSGGPMHGDRCGIYELVSNGVQRNVEPGGRVLAAERQQACWRGRG